MKTTLKERGALMHSLCWNQPGMAADVLTFMLAFDQIPSSETPTPADAVLAERLMQEEIAEMWRGFYRMQDEGFSLEARTEFADGALDTIYAILWTLLKFNFPVEKLWAEIQRSNMAKLNADGSYTKREDGKVKKPDSWTPPNLEMILTQHFTEARKL